MHVRMRGLVHLFDVVVKFTKMNRLIQQVPRRLALSSSTYTRKLGVHWGRHVYGQLQPAGAGPIRARDLATESSRYPQPLHVAHQRSVVAAPVQHPAAANIVLPTRPSPTVPRSKPDAGL